MASLLDERFLQGVYRGTPRHAPDIAAVLERAQQQGVAHIIITAGTLEESRRALQYAREWNRQYHGGIRFGSTVGVHPTRCAQVFEESAETADEILPALYDVCVDGLSDGTVVAYGELGLDYDREEFCARSVQHHYLQRQLQEIALPLNLPLFLHNRSAQSDLLDLLLFLQREYLGASSSSAPRKWNGTFRGVVHSFDDTIELAQAFIEQLGLYIGINGCSLRTAENLATVRQLPLERILLETEYVGEIANLEIALFRIAVTHLSLGSLLAVVPIVKYGPHTPDTRIYKRIFPTPRRKRNLSWAARSRIDKNPVTLCKLPKLSRTCANKV